MIAGPLRAARPRSRHSDEDRILLQASARIAPDDEKGTLAEQLEHRGVYEPLVPALIPARLEPEDTPPPLPLRELIFSNGYGGFTADSRQVPGTTRYPNLQ